MMQYSNKYTRRWGWNFNKRNRQIKLLDKINDILVKIESIFSKSYVENVSAHTNSTAVSSVSPSLDDSNAKLSKLTLDKFNGELLSWQSFGISIL